jgi:ribose/xylose/arabinose/galactoside ABC-type transport system permease subunit
MSTALRVKKILRSKSFTLIIVLVIVLITFRLLNDNYLSKENIRNILYAASLAGTIGVGLCCIMLSGEVDLSSGTVGCMGGLIVAFFLQKNIPWVISLVLAMMYGAAAGWINAFMANRFRIFPFIGTLAMSFVWQGAGYLMTNNLNIPVDNGSFWKLGGSILEIPVPFLIMIVLMAIYGVMLSSTRFGRKIYMMGGNRAAARLAGVNINKMYTILFMNGGALAALAGSVMASRMHTASPSAIQGREFDAIIALILGGVSFRGGSGGMAGGLIGLLLLSAFNNGLVLVGLDAYWQIAAGGFLLVIALTIDSFSERGRQKALKASHALAR